MTRNPETTEAARAALLARLSRILGEVPVGTLDLLNVLIGPDCAPYTAAVLAVSPAVTEGERADVEEERIDALENALVEYDERGDLFGTSGAGAYFLAKFLVDRGWTPPAPSPAVTAAEDETRAERVFDGFGAASFRGPAPVVVAAVPAEEPQCRYYRGCGANAASCGYCPEHCRLCGLARVPAEPNKGD